MSFAGNVHLRTPPNRQFGNFQGSSVSLGWGNFESPPSYLLWVDYDTDEANSGSCCVALHNIRLCRSFHGLGSSLDHRCVHRLSGEPRAHRKGQCADRKRPHRQRRARSSRESTGRRDRDRRQWPVSDSGIDGLACSPRQRSGNVIRSERQQAGDGPRVFQATAALVTFTTATPRSWT